MFMYKYDSGLLPSIFTVCLNIINMFTVTIQDNLHKYKFMETLEIRLRSIRVKGVTIWNYFNTTLELIRYSIMHYKCILKQLYYIMMLTCNTITISFLHLHAVLVYY